jgi:putative sigma-54 modulation protein
MQVNITFRHLEPTEALKSHVRGRVEHVQRFFDRPTETHAVLHVENLHHHAEITVKAGRFLLRGTAKSQDMYASIDAAADKIERQLKKHKERIQDHKTPARPFPPLDIRHDILDVIAHPEKPRTVDEAVMQLDLLDAKFFVFQNAKDGAINVVFRRDDGNMGLIEARGS